MINSPVPTNFFRLMVFIVLILIWADWEYSAIFAPLHRASSPRPKSPPNASASAMAIHAAMPP